MEFAGLMSTDSSYHMVLTVECIKICGGEEILCSDFFICPLICSSCYMSRHICCLQEQLSCEFLLIEGLDSVAIFARQWSNFPS